MEEMNGKQEKWKEEEEEDRKKVAEWFMKQNSDNENFRETIGDLQSEVDQIRYNYNFFGAQVLEELQVIRQEIKEIKDGKMKPNSAQSEMPNLITHREKSDEDLLNVRKEFNQIQQKIHIFNKELESLKAEQKKETEAVYKFIEEKFIAFRAEFQKKSKRNGNATKPKASISAKLSNMAPIETDIVGKWKLVKQKRLAEISRKYTNENHEIRSQIIKLELSNNTFNTFFLDNQNVFRKWKANQIGSKNNKLNRWYTDDNRIITFDSTGAEKCIYSLKNDKMTITNSLGGISCSRVYDKIH